MIKKRILEFLPEPIVNHLRTWWHIRRTQLSSWKFVSGGRGFEVLERTDWINRLLQLRNLNDQECSSLIRKDAPIGLYTGMDCEGRFEAAFMDTLVMHLSPSSVFFDVGAANGLYSVIAAQICGPKNVYSFEPNPVALHCLGSNNHRYCGNQLNIIPLFVGSATKDNCIALDDYCRKKAVIPTILKIDIEGAETEALKGASRTLTDHKPLVLLEFHVRRMRDDLKIDPSEVVALLKRYGYAIRFNGHHHHLRQTGGIPDMGWHEEQPNEMLCAILGT